MKRILYGVLCEFSRTAIWPFLERQWSRQELLAISSGLSFLLLLVLLLFFLSRRWRKAIKAVGQNRLANGNGGASGSGNRGRGATKSEEALAEGPEAERFEASTGSEPARRQRKSGAEQSLAGKQEDSISDAGTLPVIESKRTRADRRAARAQKRKIRYTIEVAAKSPRQMLAELVEDIRDLNVQNGLSSGPDAKLDAALKALEAGQAGDNAAAVKALGELIGVVERQRRDDDTVQQDDAEDLIEAAREIIKLLR